MVRPRSEKSVLFRFFESAEDSSDLGKVSFLCGGGPENMIDSLIGRTGCTGCTGSTGSMDIQVVQYAQDIQDVQGVQQAQDLQ